MSTQESPAQPPSDDDLLIQAEQKLEWAKSNFGRSNNNLAETAALLSLAASALVIARALREQTEMMAEVHLPEMGGGQ